jgi:hypothetical protein
VESRLSPFSVERYSFRFNSVLSFLGKHD